MARLPQLVARAQQAPGWARILDGVDAGGVDSRAALAALPITRKSDLKALQQRELPFGGLAATPASAAAPRVRVARPDLRSGRARPRLVALFAADVRGRRARRRPAAELLLVPLHAGRLHGRRRRRAHRLRGDPGRRRPDRNAGAGDGRPAPRHLRRHALLPAHHHRKGARDGRRHQQRAACADGRRGAARIAARLVPRQRRAARVPDLRVGRYRQHRLRNRAAAACSIPAWWWTRT